MGDTLKDMIIYHKTHTNFYGRYREHDIEITLNTHSDDHGLFYIIVVAPDGTYAYDGWAPIGIGISTMEAAILEAIDGAEL